MKTKGRPSAVRWALIVFVMSLATLGFTAAPGWAQVSPSYPDTVFTDGLEAGNLSAWTQTVGNGTVAVTPLAAHTGGQGLRLSNALGQYSLETKSFSPALTDSSTQFWLRTTATSGFVEVAEARESNSSSRIWQLYYNAPTRGFYFYPYRQTTSTEIYTGTNSVPAAGTWVQVEIRYNASATGGAQIYINGATQAAWGVTGNYARTNNLAILQLWNDSGVTNDFDDVTVAKPSSAPTAPAAPTSVAGTGGDQQVALTWNAPASDGGSAITGYRITPYIGATAQTAITTGTNPTSRAVTGLTNGTAYTFPVAAINAIGTGAASTASAAINPRAAPTPPTLPGAPTGSAGNASVTLAWAAPADNGGRAITSYRVTPYIGATAQHPVNTGNTSTHAVITGLPDGTAYTFTVAATNAIGTGTASAAS